MGSLAGRGSPIGIRKAQGDLLADQDSEVFQIEVG
jgi:hypothetical protein